jgi:hypothetical protein
MKFSTLFLILAVVVIIAYFVPFSETKDWFYGTNQNQSKSKKRSRNRRTSKRSAKRTSKTRKKSTSPKLTRAQRKEALDHLNSELKRFKQLYKDHYKKYKAALREWRRNKSSYCPRIGKRIKHPRPDDPRPHIKKLINQVKTKIRELRS